ncbi:S8 family serine peptidase [Robertkochia aurantiaca]|uniref:S8 family serine peptidase n=1 Tax=Robertkochia aurantiaca TaxID=2873700 RepID=UPI001CCC1E88|nr:S8 family serine peptidase [Robertkochia sp. 3YJGBD-33]
MRINLLTALFFFYLFSLGPQALSAQERKWTKVPYSSSNLAKLKALSKKLHETAIFEKEKARILALKHGWKLKKELKDGGMVELQRIGPDGAPLYYTTYNDVVVQTSRSNFLYDDIFLDMQIDGIGMQVGVWDSGKALEDHQEFDGRVTSADNASRISGHATHVMGTLLASGVDQKARGVAFNASGLTYDWTRDEGEVTDAASEGMLVSNHSYGLSARTIPDWYFGAYIYQAQDWDEIMYNAPYYLMVTAAGNTRQMNYNKKPVYGTTQDGYDMLLGFAVAKNGITVAAADDIIIDQEGNLQQTGIADFSNYGPTDDGRIKPDITGAGVNVYSSYGDSSDSYRSISGTSMAAPGVTGSLLLLQQYYNTIYGEWLRAATLKGLVLHTADEAGAYPGPDARFGWGILNARKAASLIANNEHTSLLKEQTLVNDSSFTMEVEAEEGETLMVSLSWTDAPFEKRMGEENNTESVLINDLDIIVTQGGKQYHPWMLDKSDLGGAAVQGDNTVDPFEKIEIPNASGTYTITVRHKAGLFNDQQDYSLIISGIKADDCEVVTPGGLQTEPQPDGKVRVSWEEIPDAMYELAWSKDNGETWTGVMSDTNSVDLDELEFETTYQFKVRALCSALLASEYSEPVSYTTAAPADDILPPVTDLVFQNLTGTSVELYWYSSLRGTEGVTYYIYQNGELIGSTDSNGFQISGLLPETTYVFSVQTGDSEGNVSEMSEEVTITTLNAMAVRDELAHLNFETGWSNWSESGSWSMSNFNLPNDGSRSAAASGLGSFRVMSPELPASEYDFIEIRFYVATYISSPLDRLLVEIGDGYSWQAISSYRMVEDLEPYYMYEVYASIPARTYSDLDQVYMRINTDIGNRGTVVMLDDVTIYGVRNMAMPEDKLTRLGKLERQQATGSESVSEEVQLVHDPFDNTLELVGLVNTRLNYAIYTMTGQLLKSGNDLSVPIDLSGNARGVYVLTIEDLEGFEGKKFLLR